MPTDRERRDQAKAAAQAGRYPEAIEIYRSLWTAEGTKDLWDARGLASAFRKSGDLKNALAIGRETIAINPSFDPIVSELSWAIWQSAIKEAKDRIGDDVVDEVLRLREAGEDPYSKYAAFTWILLDVAKFDREQNNLARAERLTGLLDPQELDDAVNKFDGNTLPGDRQRLYMLRGKILKAMQRWSELESYADLVANDRSIQWANDGDAWIARWRIEAIFEQGRVEEALDLANALIKRLDEWYVHADLALYLQRLDRLDEALVEALIAANGSGPFEFKVNIFKLIASLLSETENSELAGPFVQATISIRAEKEWSVDPETTEICIRINWEPSGANMQSAQREMKKALSALVNEFDPPLHGKVTAILPSGKSGFIKDENDIDRFFGGRDITFPIECLQVGLLVTFRATTSFDKKKNRDTPAAMDIRIAD